MSPRPPCAHDRTVNTTQYVGGLRRHGPIFVVDSPRRSYGYAFGESPRIWSHGARNEARQSCAELP